MIEDCLQLFDTLKQKRFSVHVKNARATIIAKLASDKFSPAIREYLAGMNTVGVPFTDYATDPAQISQIKKLINALYHAEIALIDTETVKLRDGDSKVRDLMTLYNHTFHHIYQACYLATHFDIDLSAFSEELVILAPIFSMFQTYVAETFKEGSTGLWSYMDSRTLPHNIGVVGGIIVDQMSPTAGDVDYEFLTRFSASVPAYLDRLSGYIARFSSNVAVYEPTIDRVKLDELQENALQILSALERTRSSRVFLPIKALHYIHIIRHTITLSMSIFEQAGHLTDSTQDAVRAQLAEIKYTLLPALFALTDKVEEQVMLAPGVLSKPLMAHASNFYRVLIEYTNKFVDFSTTGEELVTIEDSKFVTARLEDTYKRITEEQVTLLRIEEAKKSTLIFFQLLGNPADLNKRLIDLPETTRAALQYHYKQIQPYVSQLNISLNNAIIGGLTQTRGYLGGIPMPLVWISSSHDTDKVSDVLLLQPILNAHFDKTIQSSQFHIKLNKSIIASVAEGVEYLTLFPYTESTGPFAINEADILRLGLVAENERLNKAPSPKTFADTTLIAQNEIAITRFEAAAATPQLAEPGELTLDQSLVLYKFYQKKCLKLEEAKKAYIEFHRIINQPIPTLSSQLFNKDSGVKNKLCNLYGVFQPYFVSALGEVPGVKMLDKKMAGALIDVFGPQKQPVEDIVIALLPFDGQIRTHFDNAQRALSARSTVYADVVNTLTYRENNVKPLVAGHKEADRAHYVISHTKYSKAISDFRASLNRVTLLFNEPIRVQLARQRTSTGLPFPELEDINSRLQQSSQVLVIKQLFNCLYHLEEIAKGVEALHDKSAETMYAYKVLQIGSHVNEAIFLAQAIAATPAFSLLAGELKGNLDGAYHALLEIQNHYIPTPLPGEVSDASTGHTPVLYYVLNVLSVLPNHVLSVREEESISPEEIRSFHQHTKKLTTDIERIIANSDSYFKLFLEVPTMYALFRELKGKIAELASVSHHAVMDKLAVINDDLLTKMLLEADRWEDKVGLAPGTLTAPMKEMLDAFYQGLLEPMGLKSQQHITLISSMSPVDQRLLAANKRVEENTLEQRRVKEKHEVLERLAERIKSYKLYPATEPRLREAMAAILLSDYKSALPILSDIKPNFAADIPSPNDAGRALDSLLNADIAPASKIENIEMAVTVGVSYLKGLRASIQLTVDTAQEKARYLTALKVTQGRLNNEFIDRYTKICFTKKTAVLAAKQVGLIHCGPEYSTKLTEYIKSAEAEIVAAAKTTEDINKTVGNLIRIKIRQFEMNNYRYYQHLEMIIPAINQFTQYISQANVAVDNQQSQFETRATLDSKSEAIIRLNGMASDASLPIRERLSTMKTFVEDPLFQRKMLAHREYDSFTWAWLNQCFLVLLEGIRLYVPDHKKCNNQLIKTLQPPQITQEQVGARHRLFTALTLRRGYDLPSFEAPAP